MKRLLRWLAMFFGRGVPVALKPFDPMTPVLTLGGDPVYLGQCFGGIVVTGEVSSGKTSGPGDVLMRALMLAGCGFVVLCAKDTEAERMLKICRQVGREADYLRVYPGGKLLCDFILYEMSQPGANVESVCQMLDKLIEAIQKQSGGDGDDKFFLETARRLLRAVMHLLHLLDGKVSLDRMVRIIRTAPMTTAQLASPEWRKASICGQYVDRAAADAKLTGGQARDLQMAIGLIEEMATWGEKTRGIVMTLVVNTLSLFLGGDIYDLCASGQVTISPDDARAGKIICIDVPVLKYNEVGLAVALVWKMMTQRAILRNMQDRPTALWVDEAQFFCLPDNDVKFATVSREYRGIDVMLFQNFEVLIDALGGTMKAEKQAYGLLANHTLKFICANSSMITNKFYEEMFGGSWKQVMGGVIDPAKMDLVDDLMGFDPNPGFNFSSQYHSDVRAHEMSRLLKGGEANGYLVTAYMYMGGRTWSNGKTWKLVTFKQRK